jgi:hypothetical protein
MVGKCCPDCLFNVDHAGSSWECKHTLWVSRLCTLLSSFLFHSLRGKRLSGLKLGGPATYLVFALLAVGCSAQTWAANSWSRWASYSCLISSRDSPTTGPEGLNSQLRSGSQRIPTHAAWPQYKHNCAECKNGTIRVFTIERLPVTAFLCLPRK